MFKNINMALIDDSGLRFNKISLKVSNDIYDVNSSFKNDKKVKVNIENKKSKHISNSAKNYKYNEKIKYDTLNTDCNIINNSNSNYLLNNSNKNMKFSASLKNLKTPIKINHRPSSAKNEVKNLKINEMLNHESKLKFSLPNISQSILSTPATKIKQKNNKINKPAIPKYNLKVNQNKLTEKDQNKTVFENKQNLSTINIITEVTNESSNMGYFENISSIEQVNKETNLNHEEITSSFQFTFNSSIMKDKLKTLKDFKYEKEDKENQKNKEILNSSEFRNLLKSDEKEIFRLNSSLNNEIEIIQINNNCNKLSSPHLKLKMNKFRKMDNIQLKLNKEKFIKKNSNLNTTFNTTNFNKFPSLVEDNNIEYKDQTSMIISNSTLSNFYNKTIKPTKSKIPLSKQSRVNNFSSTGFFEKRKIIRENYDKNLIENSNFNNSKRSTPKLIKNHPCVKEFFNF